MGFIPVPQSLPSPTWFYTSCYSFPSPTLPYGLEVSKLFLVSRKDKSPDRLWVNQFPFKPPEVHGRGREGSVLPFCAPHMRIARQADLLAQLRVRRPWAFFPSVLNWDRLTVSLLSRSCEWRRAIVGVHFWCCCELLSRFCDSWGERLFLYVYPLCPGLPR